MKQEAEGWGRLFGGGGGFQLKKEVSCGHSPEHFQIGPSRTPNYR